jgi:hypothetical protein
LRRTDIEEQCKPADLPDQLQELRLPVLERVARHLDDIAARHDGLGMFVLLVDIGEPAEHPMTGDCENKETGRHPTIGIAAPGRGPPQILA